jgi:hypothetical protein
MRPTAFGAPGLGQYGLGGLGFKGLGASPRTPTAIAREAILAVMLE